MSARPLFIASPDELSRDFIFDGHAGAGPSGAERWMHCTESIQQSRAFLETLTPNQQAEFALSSLAARQGTTAHAAAEAEAQVMLGQMDQAELDTTLLELAVNPATEAEAYDTEMAEYIAEYVDLLRQYHDSGREVLVEQRVVAPIPLTGRFEGDTHMLAGSADGVVLPHPSDPAEQDLVVADLKYGDGLYVEVEANPQIRIYALGVLTQLMDMGKPIPDRLTYHIVQPRLGGIKTWTESVAALIHWRDKVLAPALTAAVYGEGAVFEPSTETCQWCPARGNCPALVQARLDEAAPLFDLIVEAEFADGPGSFPETSTLDSARLGALLQQITGLTKIADDLKQEAQRRLHRGEQVPGYKLVGYQPPRKWVPGVEHGLAGVIQMVSKPESPTQLLARAKKEKWDEHALDDVNAHVVTPAAKPVIAPDGDRRKEWAGLPPEVMFELEGAGDSDGLV